MTKLIRSNYDQMYTKNSSIIVGLMWVVEIHCGGFHAQRNCRVEQENRADSVAVGGIKSRRIIYLRRRPLIIHSELIFSVLSEHSL